MRPAVVALARRLQTFNYWLIAGIALTGIRLLRLLPPRAALNLVDRLARRVGPWFGRHRTALSNLRAAYPEKTEAEIEAIASDMWGNMARLAGEYIFLDAFLEHEPGTLPDTLDVEGEEIFKRLVAERGRPHIIFTAHLGNFELLPILGAFYGLEVTSLFRAPNNPYIADHIERTRASKMGGLIASRAGAAFSLARVLERGGNVGVLVDQKFSPGLRTEFFGRPCDTSPLVPKLARQYECDVYPARSIRLPGNRFRLILEDRLDLPRKDDGTIDVQASGQLLNNVVERWVREDPGQWMWFHKRWHLSQTVRKVR